METIPMGRVLVRARVENLSDLHLADRGVASNDDVRAVDIENALVDTGVTMLSLPRSVIATLGLRKFKTKRVRTSAGVVEVDVYGAVRLAVQGRDCTVDVLAVPDDCPALIGQVPLELMDWVVDPRGQRLIGNPEHGGEHMFDLF